MGKGTGSGLYLTLLSHGSVEVNEKFRPQGQCVCLPLLGGWLDGLRLQGGGFPRGAEGS